MDSMKQNVAEKSVAQLKIGWADANITPEEPVLIMGQFYNRVSEGVQDPLTATTLVLDTGDDYVIFVSCDLVAISNDLRDTVRRYVTEKTSAISPFKVVLNATHTHTGAEVRIPFLPQEISSDIREKLDAIKVDDYTQFAAERIAEAIIEAWDRRAPGGVAYGQGYAVIGRNRRWVDADGQSTMYGLVSSVHERFRHIEGIEDHSINVLAAYDSQEQLTGILINLACPSQEGEHGFELSADWWHETREELRTRYGRGLFILPQCSAAGELTSHLIYDQRAHERMLGLKGRSARQEVACRIADAVDEVLPYIKKTITSALVLRHQVETIPLMKNPLTEQDAAEAERDANTWKQKYEEERQKLFTQPERFKEPRWYMNVTMAYQRSQWHSNVVHRYKQQQHTNELSVEIHVIRIGDIVFATNPFEYYVDYGVQIKVRSPAVQTFLVQLAGEGTYVPSPRSVSGGGYGSVPASNVIGTEGGQQLAEYTVSAIRSLWAMDR